MGWLSERVAGAPITWGVCEVPGWGYQMPPERVLREMSEIGLRATEVGPEGYLPSDSGSRQDLLDSHGLRAIAGFIPLVLHRREVLASELVRAAQEADALADTGCTVLVLAASAGEAENRRPRRLDDAVWGVLREGIDRVIEIGAERGLTVALHPHQGTLVEGAEDVLRVLDGSTVSVCLDTGHLLVGGADPGAIAASSPGRVAHVHLKDVSGDLAERVRDGSCSYHEAVQRGIYRPLGEGDVDVGRIVRLLESSGYRGWYVLEQDTVLEAEPDEGTGPIVDAEASLAFLGRLEGEVSGQQATA